MSDATTAISTADPDIETVLAVNNLTRSFGGLKAVDVDHLEFQKHKITALIGPNGAGKTTFFNLISGFDRADSGTWNFNGRDMTTMAPHRVAKSGLIRTFQLTKALGRLTVLQNVMLGASQQTGESLWAAMIAPLWRQQENDIKTKAFRLLKQFKLDHLEDEFAANLSGGQRKLLEMARALMADPDVLLLDEPMAGVNPALTQSLLGHIQNIRDQGRTVIFVEHDMDVVRDISDWVVVMAEGKVICQGHHKEVVSDPRVIGAYLGTHHDTNLRDLETQDDLPAEDAT